MREPEFLPEWYRQQLRRSHRRGLAVRAAVGVALVTGVGVAALPPGTPADVLTPRAAELTSPHRESSIDPDHFHSQVTQ